ncbi:TIGR03087 family PEP-CTERM/XrtA system glycosyltransferase [Novosphingobium sp. FSY-8]|uniref:TIGR03087 family PEP-CTERM/XrtA system glycosyltransferase n=1 Tax=Novosphingobium ovatum TaxID=1908523 RepID=A0ABW9XC16_9SPHN|nr:TIGR03087 family PEP-CTERM/XrtA system glycosyltransferase [Novosphingobium ovatum]NBC36076.1 TIGR03087 family PEP-CTERM/XrtA system glycosyltransferase [Novosphingobium ovatum]
MSAKDILFLAHRIPFPPDRGDKIRSHHILRRLARMAPVHVACFADDQHDMAEEVELAAMAHSYRLVTRSKPLAVAGMQALWRRAPISLTAFHDPQLARYVRDLVDSGRIGAIYVFSGQMGQYVPAGFTGRVVMDFVDVDSAKFDAYALERSGLMGHAYKREGRLLRAEEARLAARADVSLLITEAEAALFRQRLPHDVAAVADVRVLGNGIDADHFDPMSVRPVGALRDMPGPRFIFTGQMDYPPNVAAVLRVAQRILPQIRRELPEATFHIVGRAPTEEVTALDGRDGVHVWGRVDDIRQWLRASDIALVPLEIARGVQNKVLEAMAMELPVVVSSAAATGIPAQPGVHLAVADHDEDLARLAVALVRDPRRAATMGVTARRLVVDRQSWQGALMPLAQIMAPSAFHPRDDG